MRILVIDDDAVVREMICKMLDGEGFDISTAIDGSKGLNLLRKESKIALVITDLIMPEKEGIETIKEIKQDFPSIKIIAMSGGGRGDSTDYLRMAKVMGADLTLRKPFLKKDLLKVVRELC